MGKCNRIISKGIRMRQSKKKKEWINSQVFLEVAEIPEFGKRQWSVWERGREEGGGEGRGELHMKRSGSDALSLA